MAPPPRITAATDLFKGFNVFIRISSLKRFKRRPVSSRHREQPVGRARYSLGNNHHVITTTLLPRRLGGRAKILQVRRPAWNTDVAERGIPLFPPVERIRRKPSLPVSPCPPSPEQTSDG